MGAFGGWFFNEKDTMIIEEIAKLYGVAVQDVAKHYKEMVDKIKNEIKD